MASSLSQNTSSDVLLGAFACRSPVKEEDVRLDSLSIENACGEAEQRVDVAFLQELPAHNFAGAPLKENVVRYHHCSPPANLENGFDVLNERELLVAGTRPEVLTYYRQILPFLITFVVHHPYAGLSTERRVGEDHVVAVARIGGVASPWCRATGYG